MDMFLFRIVVQTPSHGEMVGDWTKPLTAEQIVTIRDAVKDSWERLTYLSINVGENEIVIPIEVLHQSITILETTTHGEGKRGIVRRFCEWAGKWVDTMVENWRPTHIPGLGECHVRRMRR